MGLKKDESVEFIALPLTRKIYNVVISRRCGEMDVNCAQSCCLLIELIALWTFSLPSSPRWGKL